MHRLRLSSEGPEVVSQIPDKFFVPYAYKSPRSLLYPNQLDTKSQIPLYPLRLSRQESSVETEPQNQNQGARSCSLVLTVILIILAFLLGGGIGGGVGGAFIAKDHAKIASLTSSLAVLPTVTLPPATTQTACFVDQAGCPNINNVPYTASPGNTFLQMCEMNIISKTAESIDISSSIQTSWKACMNSCADYNTKVKQGGCQGATWQLFSTNSPSNNSICTLKSSAAVTTLQPTGDQLCSGVLQS